MTVTDENKRSLAYNPELYRSGRPGDGDEGPLGGAKTSGSGGETGWWCG